MATSKKPRKAYKPKGIARPLTQDQSRDLDLAARVHVNKLWLGTLDEQGWNTLAALINVAAVIDNDGQFDGAVRILESIRARQIRTGKYGATGYERNTFMDLFNDAVDLVCRSSNKKLAESLQTVIGAMV